MHRNLRCKDRERFKGWGQWAGSLGPKAGGTPSSVFSLSKGTVERPALGNCGPKAS